MIESDTRDKTKTSEAAGVATYALRHGDDCLILAQRLAEWSARAPELEEDIALTNIALDILGQARALLTYAGEAEGAGRTEDDLAYFRSEREYTNLLLVEQPNGDFAQTMARQALFDSYHLALWESLADSADPTLAGVAGKAVKESTYHWRHSSAWVVRLGDGTEESHRRMQAGLDAMWRFTGEMFETDPLTEDLAARGIAADPELLRGPWEARLDAVLAEAGLTKPQDPFQMSGGRTGRHTEHLGFILAEMQIIQRSHPGLEW